MAHRGRGGRPSAIQEVAVDKFRVVSAWLRDYITAIKYGHIHPFTSMERKAREATRNQPWGPTGSILTELAEASQNSVNCEIVFAVIQLRLGYPPEKWRNVYKALVLLDFLVLRGSEQCIQITDEELLYKLQDLERFTFTNPEGKDQGVNVRHRAKAIRELMLDPQRLRAERQGCAQQRKLYQGFTRDQLAAVKPFQDDQDMCTPTGTRTGLRRSLSDSSMQDAAHGFGNSHSEPQHRNAGETKGVTMEMNRKQLAELKKLLNLPHNRYCADCVGGGAAARASWASINLGVFLCMRCAGVHRGLGTHISKMRRLRRIRTASPSQQRSPPALLRFKSLLLLSNPKIQDVRSCTLDTWLPEQVEFMEKTGNLRANKYFEARLEADLKPAYGSNDLDPFIRRKYDVRAYAEGTWPPSNAVSLASDNHEVQNDKPGRPVLDTPSATPVQAPQQRSNPRLQGRRSLRGTNSRSGLRRQSSRLSVPLPPATQLQRQPSSKHAQANDDLMAFESGELPSRSSAPEAGTPPPPGDAFADLQALVPRSLLDDDAGFGQCTGTASLYEADQNKGVRLERGVSQGAGSCDQGQQSLQAFPQWGSNGHYELRLPVSQAASSSMPQAHANSLAFMPTPMNAGQTSREWQWLSEQHAGKRQLPYLHVHASSLGGESDIASVASMSFLTPRMTALCGPGPPGSAMKGFSPAPVRYMPPEVADKVRGAGSKPEIGAESALVQAAKVWSANAKQGEKGIYEDLVLQAMADLPPSKRGGGIQEVLAAVQAPKAPSMLQQRCGPVHPLTI